MKFLRRFYLVLFIISCTAFYLGAQIVEEEDALSISESFISNFFIDYSTKIESITAYGSDEQPLIYIVNLVPEGWILVSGNKGASPIIGYNYEDKFVFPEENTRNPAYNWLKQSADQLEELYTYPAENENRLWIDGFSTDQTKSTKSVNPLISVNWGQGSGYNQYCPTVLEGPDNKALVGCVAVAMAQALSVFEEPAQGTGSNTYTHISFGTIQNDFSESFYQWDLMLEDEPTTHTALLLYDCATAVDMDFGGTSSSATTSRAANAFIDFFGGADNIVYLPKSDYGAAFWEGKIINELEYGRPLIYRGRHDDGGHAFNIDGVDNSNYFHVNWGWYGNSNGYFLLDALNPGSRTYNLSQAAIFNIQPQSAIVGIEDEPDKVFSLYPNPTTSIIRFNNISADQVSRVRVFSTSGVLLKSIDSGSFTGNIDLSGLNTGIYIIEATLNENTIIRRKIVKQ
jgi:hypothetical protein